MMLTVHYNDLNDLAGFMMPTGEPKEVTGAMMPIVITADPKELAGVMMPAVNYKRPKTTDRCHDA